MIKAYHSWKIIIILILVTLLLMLLSITQGEYPISVWVVLKTLFGWSGNPDAALVIYNLRLPRMLVAWLVGIALAISGTLLQSLTLNPLADSGIIGINGGAAFAAVMLLVVFKSTYLAFLPFAAFVGGMSVAMAIYGLAWYRSSSTLRLILVGIGLNLIFSAITNIIITFGNIQSVSQALVWLVGSVYGKGWSDVVVLLPWVIILSIFSWYLSKQLNALSLGEELARGLGVEIKFYRLILLLIAVALASGAVAIAGTIGFVGLIAPHLARLWVGNIHSWLIPVAALWGGFLVVSADLVGRCLFAPLEIPCGIITAILGAPYFLYLLQKKL